MSVVIGQEFPENPVDTTPIGMIVYYDDGTEDKITYQNTMQFNVAFKQLDATKIVSINLIQVGRYGRYDTDGVARYYHYRLLIHTNDDETTTYWLTKDGKKIQEGNNVDVPDGAESKPKKFVDPDPILDIELKALNKRDFD